jgi:hypothetical protein
VIPGHAVKAGAHRSRRPVWKRHAAALIALAALAAWAVFLAVRSHA